MRVYDTGVNRCHVYNKAEDFFPGAVMFLSVYSYYTYYYTISMKKVIIMTAAEIRSCAWQLLLVLCTQLDPIQQLRCT